MNDLLSTVRPSAPSGADASSTDAGDVELGMPHHQSHELGDFFKRVEDIKGDMAEIRALQRDISAQYEKGKTIIKTKEMQKQQADMQDKINRVSALAHKVKAKLEAVDKDNDTALGVPGQGVGSNNERTRSSITGGLRIKLKELMGDFTDLREQIQSEYREVVKQRVYTVTGQHLDDENVDTIIQNGEAETIFQKAIQEQGRGRVMDTLAEIQERHRDMQGLEKSLLELHQIFMDMAVLVETQGVMFDNIEKQVERAVDHVQNGTVMLVEAREHQKNTRKWMWWGITILTVIAIIIVLAVVLSVKPWQ